MAIVDLLMPKMGESIMEATILKWNKRPGDFIQQDESLLEIATDKVDSEVPSIAAGILKEILFPENAVVPVGSVIARIESEVSVTVKPEAQSPTPNAEEEPVTGHRSWIFGEPLTDNRQPSTIFRQGNGERKNTSLSWLTFDQQSTSVSG